MQALGDRANRLLVLAAVASIAAAAVVLYAPGSGDAGPPDQDASGGGVDVDRVASNFSEAVEIYVSPVDGPSLVDPFVPMLDPGESAGPATLNCTSQWGEATELRVLARTLDEGDTIADRRVELEVGDCQPGGGTSFDVALLENGTVAIERVG